MLILISPFLSPSVIFTFYISLNYIFSFLSVFLSFPFNQTSVLLILFFSLFSSPTLSIFLSFFFFYFLCDRFSSVSLFNVTFFCSMSMLTSFHPISFILGFTLSSFSSLFVWQTLLFFTHVNRILSDLSFYSHLLNWNSHHDFGKPLFLSHTHFHF